IHLILFPRASLHLLNISLLAIFSCWLYQKPILVLISYLLASLCAQKNNALFIPVSAAPLAIIFSYTFSSSLGTVVKKSGCTSRKLSARVSRLSAKYIAVPLNMCTNEIILSKTWLRGRKLSARIFSPGGKQGMLAITFDNIFLWESITPFGLPVVPEVYIMVARSSYLIFAEC